LVFRSAIVFGEQGQAGKLMKEAREMAWQNITHELFVNTSKYYKL